MGQDLVLWTELLPHHHHFYAEVLAPSVTVFGGN